MNRWFAETQGTERVVAAAGEFWSTLLKEKLTPLEVLLSHVRASSEAQALDRGEQVFNAWLAGVDSLWREKAED